MGVEGVCRVLSFALTHTHTHSHVHAHAERHAQLAQQNLMSVVFLSLPVTVLFACQ